MSHVENEYRYTIEVYKKDFAAHLGSVPIQPDFGPVLQWAALEAIRKIPDDTVVLDPAAGRIEPCWDAKLDNPYLCGIRAIMEPEEGPVAAFEIPTSYFQNLAQSISPALVESGKLESGEVFQYLVCAYPAEPQAHAEKEPQGLLSVKAVTEAIPVDQRPMDAFLTDSSPFGAADDNPIPVFLPRAVIDETVLLMRQAGATETGGILIGNLHRDGDAGELFLEVTAQIPVQYAEQELTRLTFTPQSWSAVDAAISLRGRGEMYVGWWHTHPADKWCDACPPETQQKCKSAGKLSGDFFSAHDVALHRTVFPRAYSVALVLSNNCEDINSPHWQLYGWHQGTVAARSFYLLDADVPVGGRVRDPSLRSG